VVVLELLHGRAIVDFGTRPGTLLDLHASAHGKVALAFGSQGLLERCLAKPLKAWTPHTICSHTAIRRAISQVRSDGWATAPNQVLLGVNGLAAPVLDHRGVYAGGIAIAGSIQSVPGAPSSEQIASVTATAERISRKLGWRASEDQRAMANKRRRR
jgi:DNA-binding IclR family transcriptional regulator